MLVIILHIIAILLEWFSTIFSTGDDIFKGVISFLTLLFGGSKVWDFWQKWREGDNKLEEARINADKEIKNNADKHRVELEKLQTTIDHQKSEIVYKDGIITESKRQIEEYKNGKSELIRINEEKDRTISQMHERLLECERSKNK